MCSSDLPAPLAVDGSRLTLSDFRLAALDGHIDLKRLLLDWSGPLKYETRGSLEELAPLRLHQLLGVDEQKNLDALKDVRIGGQWQLRGQGAQALYGDVQAGIITDRFLPDKAIDLIDEAASRIKMELDSKPEQMDKLDRRIIQLKMEKMHVAKESDDASKKRLELIDDYEIGRASCRERV